MFWTRNKENSLPIRTHIWRPASFVSEKGGVKHNFKATNGNKLMQNLKKSLLKKFQGYQIIHVILERYCELLKLLKIL